RLPAHGYPHAAHDPETWSGTATQRRGTRPHARGRRSMPTVCRTQTTMLETAIRLPIEQRLHVARELVQAVLGRHFTVDDLVLGRRQRGRILGGDGEVGEGLNLRH